MGDDRRERVTFPGLPPWPERATVARILRTETTGGLILLVAAAVALVWANSPWGASYARVRDLHVGIPPLGLDMSVAHWTAEGLLTIFFLVAGIELKRELVTGELGTPSTATLPVVAAAGGVAVPAAVYLAVAGIGGGSMKGWAVPMATDIAFALAVLAVLGTHLPAAMRAFLLTLAVVDDLGAILVIAIVFTAGLHPPALAGAGAGLVVFHLLQRYRIGGWWWYVPLGTVIWALTYKGGVHATVAGVAMGLILRARPDRRAGEDASPADRAEHLLRPVSAAVAAPLFALFAAGVRVSAPAIGAIFVRPELLGVVLGLVAGKTAGIVAGTWLAARFTRARLSPGLAWADVVALAALGGIGFTVALLIGELAFTDPGQVEHVKAAVLVGSVTAAVVAALLVRRRNRVYRALWEAEGRDAGADGGPDAHRRP
ncbi:Na+/H+ antiporter NhaA [Actinoallomurus spadix]|uniref:Na(+)/H(+) antiporter NhaA n=1 Tax=Actinoallomurus spadix TaxID=79912 RepID=A0ABN0W9C2_9ACTN|nr:Na+/H+ antiporter NhaA [Actinoallomurus spadix]MCO5988471.1 Na+/H+ antiporter NhaA [Actinoallomurus spadix]